jgi:two-component system OmpR family response regulator
MRLLIVEDDKGAREFIERALREAGHGVDSTGHGRDGLYMASSENYDLLILDRMLPQIDVGGAIRRHRARPHVAPARRARGA